MIFMNVSGTFGALCITNLQFVNLSIFWMHFALSPIGIDNLCLWHSMCRFFNLMQAFDMLWAENRLSLISCEMN